MQKVSRYLYRTEISAIVAYFCSNLVVVATPFAPFKIQITYLNSPTPKTTPYMQKVPRYLYRTEISAIVAYFLPKFGCHGNALSAVLWQKEASDIQTILRKTGKTFCALALQLRCTQEGTSATTL